MNWLHIYILIYNMPWSPFWIEDQRRFSFIKEKEIIF